MHLTAIADHVIIIPNSQPEKTQGGIFLPEDRWEDQIVGRVIAVGPGPRRNSGGPMQCEEGDYVLARKTVFFPFVIPDDKTQTQYMCIQEADIICIL